MGDSVSLMGNCEFCNKEIYNLGEDMPNNPAYAAFITRNKSNTVMVYGTYGSAVADLSEGYFVDKYLYFKMNEKLKPYNHFTKDQDYLFICDDCLQKLINENRVHLVEVYNDIFSELGDEFSSFEVISDPYGTKITPIHTKLVSYTFSQLKKAQNENKLFILYGYSFRHNRLLDVIYMNDDKGQLVEQLKMGDVLVFFSENDYEVISETKFKTRYTFV